MTVITLPGKQKARLKQFRYASPSQLDSYDGETGCPRKWWLSKRVVLLDDQGKDIELPEQDQSFFAFGNAFHATTERYLKADDQGYLHGKPVELYPAGWDRALMPDKWGRPKEAQAQLLKELIEETEMLGYLARRPGREVELSLKDMPIGDTGIKLWGYVDHCVVPGLAQDWKTPTTIRYRLNEKKILVNNQAVVYSDAIMRLARQRGIPVGDGVDFQFVYATKDPDRPKGKRVSMRNALMTPAHVEWQMGRVIDIVERMKITAVCEDIWTVPAVINSENQIPNERACSAYGGCPFLAICTKNETLPAFVRRITRLNRESGRIDDSKRLTQETTQETTQGETKVPGLFDHLVGNKGKTPQQQSEATKAAEAVEATSPGTLPIRPPWAKHPDHGAPGSCIACGGKGFASNGAPCRACATWAQSNRMPVHFFEIQGSRWTLKAEHKDEWKEEWGPMTNIPAAEQAPPEAETPADAVLGDLLSGGAEAPQETSEAPASETSTETAPASEAPVAPVVEPEKPEAAPAAAPAAPAASAPPASNETAAAKPKAKAGRKPEGFKLLIGCVGLKLPKGAPVKFITEVMAEIVEPRVAAALHAETYYHIGHFERKDWVPRVIDHVVNELGRSWVVVNVRGQDINHLVALLQPHAQMVIQGVMA